MTAISRPRARPLILDETFDQGTGLQAIPVRQAFIGENLRISTKGNGVHYDPESGCVLVPTAQAQDGNKIRVEAENAAGRCHLDLMIAVEAEEDPAILASFNADLAHTRDSRTVSADGVEFLFDRARPVGHFITGADGQGDPFVVGPVTLQGYTPGPVVVDGREMNGAMLNPVCGPRSGFDSFTRNDTYLAKLNAGLTLPISLQPGDSLIVCVSNPDAKKINRVAQRFVVLSCLAEVPFADSFRPPYSGPERPIWRLSDIDPTTLAALPVTAHPNMPKQGALEKRFRRCAIETENDWNRDHLIAEGHAPPYGRDLCQNEADPYIWVNLDIPYARKENILAGLIQRGIDRYGAFRSARVIDRYLWGANGGHHSGRKFSILFAGQLLGDPAMLSIMAQMRGADGAEPRWFQEDGMSFHVTQSTVDITNSADWKPAYWNDKSKPKQPYDAGMIGMPDWRGKPREIETNAAWLGHPYRIAGNSNTQHGQVLAILAMGLQDAWGHDAYFDYHMRYMDIMDNRQDPFRFRGQKQALYNPVKGSRNKNGWDDWMKYWEQKWAWDMLQQHRPNLYRFPWQT